MLLLAGWRGISYSQFTMLSEVHRSRVSVFLIDAASRAK
jgi:hypothetical protein